MRLLRVWSVHCNTIHFLVILFAPTVRCNVAYFTTSLLSEHNGHADALKNSKYLAKKYAIMDTPHVQFLYCVSHCVNGSNKFSYTWLAEKQSNKLFKWDEKQALDSAAYSLFGISTRTIRSVHLLMLHLYQFGSRCGP